MLVKDLQAIHEKHDFRTGVYGISMTRSGRRVAHEPLALTFDVVHEGMLVRRTRCSMNWPSLCDPSQLERTIECVSRDQLHELGRLDAS